MTRGSGGVDQEVDRETDRAPETATERIAKALGRRPFTHGDPEYDESRRVYFTGMDRRPAAVVRVTTRDEVALVVREVREAGARLSVKGGGHGFGGQGVADGAVALDLSGMRGIEVDPEERVARALPGLTTVEFTQATAEHGLATGFGDSGSVGIGGITLAGGIGLLHRRFGLTIDSLLGAEVVTADGTVVHADAKSHPELFWALRGGGGNFGIVTRFDYRLHPVDEVVGGMLLVPGDPGALVKMVEAFREAPETVSGLVNAFRAPPVPMFPPELHGRFLIGALVVYSGDPAGAEEALRPLRDVGDPVMDQIAPARYLRMFDEAAGPLAPPRLRMRSAFVDSLDLGAAQAVFEHLATESRAMMRMVQLRILGGAVARVAPEETAFPNRARAMLAGVGVMFGEEAEEEEHADWASTVTEGLTGGRPASPYVGFLGEDGPELVRAAYPGTTWQRLREVKTHYDPDNFFQGNQNVPP